MSNQATTPRIKLLFKTDQPWVQLLDNSNFVKLFLSDLLEDDIIKMLIALGSEFEETTFTPAHYNDDYTIHLKNKMLYQFLNKLNIVENSTHKLDTLVFQLANEFLDKKNSIRKRFIAFDWIKLKRGDIHIHDEYHLGQVLAKDNDYYVLDFEGEPERTTSNRKEKQPSLKDVASLFKSFYYSIRAIIFNNKEGYYKASKEALFNAVEILYNYISGLFLGTYVTKKQNANLGLGYNQEHLFILKYCLLKKAVYELGYELNSRPKRAVILLKGISNIINH